MVRNDTLWAACVYYGSAFCIDVLDKTSPNWTKSVLIEWILSKVDQTSQDSILHVYRRYMYDKLCPKFCGMVAVRCMHPCSRRRMLVT